MRPLNEFHPLEPHLPRIQRYGVLLCSLLLGLGILGTFPSHPNSLTMVGIVLLVLLPVIRAALLLIVFLLRRDFLYAALTTMIFSILLAGVLSARFFGA